MKLCSVEIPKKFFKATTLLASEEEEKNLGSQQGEIGQTIFL
jgi:hypothetical protein